MDTIRGAPLQRMQTVLPQEAIEDAIGEVREVMRQHTACADPTESAAKKERLRQAEEQGEVEEAAIHMVQANLENLSPTDGRRQRESPTPASRERVPATLRLGPQVSQVDEEENVSEGRRPVSLERIPAAQRLGPLIDPMETEDLPLMDGRSETTVKRKPGRPPGKKKIQGSPRTIVGAKRRKVTQTKTSLTRRKLVPTSNEQEKTDEKQSESRGFPSYCSFFW